MILVELLLIINHLLNYKNNEYLSLNDSVSQSTVNYFDCIIQLDYCYSFSYLRRMSLVKRLVLITVNCRLMLYYLWILLNHTMIN